MSTRPAPGTDGPGGLPGSGFADQLALMGRLPHLLLEKHRRGDDGRCVVCSVGAQSGRPQWPCGIRDVATAALVIQARMKAERSPGGVIWLEKGHGPERPERKP